MPRIEGGLTKKTFDASLTAFKATLEKAVQRYVATGGKYDANEDIAHLFPGLTRPSAGLSVSSPVTKDPFSRAEITKDYSLHCSPRIEYKPVSEMQSMLTEEVLSDCEMDILDWSFRYDGNKDLFYPSSFNYVRGSK